MSQVDKKTTNEKNILLFSRINDFVNQLSSIYGTKYPPLRLYRHMLSKTNLSHKIKIERNIQIFSKFVLDNKVELLKPAIESLNGKILFSKGIYIPIDDIIKTIEKEDRVIIQQHLVAILQCVDSSDEIKDKLKEILDPKTKEGEFFSSFIGKIEKNMGKGAPEDVIKSFMTSGALQDILLSLNNGMKDGTLDLGKMLGMVQGLVGNLSQNVPEMGNILKHLNLPEFPKIEEEKKN
jgi:hypothetical protein